MTTPQEIPYLVTQIEKLLVGASIVQAVTSADGESFGFVVHHAGHTPHDMVCWIDCDAEGNGPGWLKCEEVGQ